MTPYSLSVNTGLNKEDSRLPAGEVFATLVSFFPLIISASPKIWQKWKLCLSENRHAHYLKQGQEINLNSENVA